MKIISLLNQKGGSGKTTLATSLAHAFALDGVSVVLGDCDPQGSARDWADAGGSEICPVIGLDRIATLRDLKSIAADLVILDGAPKVADLAAAAIRISDLVLIPVQPSPYDLWAADTVVKMIRERRELADGKPATAFVITRAIQRTTLSKEIFEVLETDYPDITLLKTGTAQRVSYANSAATGGTVFSTDDSSAKSEILLLKEEIEKWL
jgi:chromosome partitioning protein